MTTGERRFAPDFEVDGDAPVSSLIDRAKRTLASWSVPCVQPVSTTLINPYSLAAMPINGTYDVNNSSYNGNPANFNTLLMTNTPDFLLLDSAGVQTMFNMNRVVMGDGNDVMDMASATFTVGDTLIFGANGNQLIWANAGNDTIQPGTSGHSTIRLGFLERAAASGARRNRSSVPFDHSLQDSPEPAGRVATIR